MSTSEPLDLIDPEAAEKAARAEEKEEERKHGAASTTKKVRFDAQGNVKAKYIVQGDSRPKDDTYEDDGFIVADDPTSMVDSSDTSESIAEDSVSESAPSSSDEDDVVDLNDAGDDDDDIPLVHLERIRELRRKENLIDRHIRRLSARVLKRHTGGDKTAIDRRQRLFGKVGQKHYDANRL